MDYTKMMEHTDADISDDQINSHLLRAIVRNLTPAQKRGIAKKLEQEREDFARSSKPGHLEWYPWKLALCAKYQDLTK